ncbi:MAG TPA: ABC transporter permease subunit [Beijerinckiaceae bacterium]|nr:ABC transporter permease subunit [Beijerinckiaceae bacterium]
MRIFGRDVPMMASLIIWCVLWEIVGRAELIKLLLPPFTDVLAAIAELTAKASFWTATATTLRCFAIGMAFAILVGVPLGILMGRSKAADRLLGMWVNVFVSAPLSALVPILMILFGLGEMTVILSVFLFAVWIIALDTQAGVAHMQRSLEEMARSYGASPSQLYSKIIFWAALPEILAGIRIGFIRGVKGVVIGQLLVSIIGYGELFELYSRNFLLAEFWALTVLLFAFAMVVAEAVGAIEKRIEYYAGVRQ